MNNVVKVLLSQQLGPAPTRDQWGGALGWIEDNHPDLYIELWLIDRATSGLLFMDPNHTISWNVATRAQAGDPIAKAICQALNALSPNHCAEVLNAGSADNSSGSV